MFITHLSGSEAERGSQSSAHSDDDDSSEASVSSSTDNELDEFGFPCPTSLPTAEDAPLVLMENWDGQFVLVQPRQDKETSRARSRRRDESNSRKNSIGGSTIGSTLADGGGLIIDPDAGVGEFSSDTDSDSFWSGLSEDGGGDTTDSMEEEDMPMLDSPALQQLIDDQMGGEALSSKDNDSNGPPAIVITDLTVIPETPSLSTGLTLANGSTNATAGPSTPAAPLMGTFHPTTDHPAHHAVIDGSKIPTKSPFTHRRRTRSTRDPSQSSNNTFDNGNFRRKRKSSINSVIPSPVPYDPFTTPNIPMTLPKRARYSSIPGHPRYIKAKRAAAQMDEETDSEDERMCIEEEEVDEEGGVAEIDLEDMLETSLLARDYDFDQGGGGGSPGDDFRFDRVPVSTYLRRNFRTHGLGGDLEYQYQYHQPTSSRARTDQRKQSFLFESRDETRRCWARYSSWRGDGLGTWW
jgi:hypothetical protein